MRSITTLSLIRNPETAGERLLDEAAIPGNRGDEIKLHARFAATAVGEERFLESPELRVFIEALRGTAA
jgi:hypothetical protein